MNRMEEEKTKEGFFQTLTPEKVINIAEEALDLPLTNTCRPLNSYINRVYELVAEDGTGLIAKFYRPGRWSREGLQDEHDFLLELQEEEIPVIAPLKLKNGKTLGLHDQMHYAIYPKKGGRTLDEYTDEQWLELGRLLGRTHLVGAKHLPKDRITLTPEGLTRKQIHFLLENDFIPSELRKTFNEVAERLLETINPLFEKAHLIRIHGDCHFSNIIHRPDESFYLIDFDDMAVGPPVQDFWMLLPGYKTDSHAEIDIFLEGYETFRGFEWSSIHLIEPLRAMRYIHYTAWCGHQYAEDGLSRVAPDFGTQAYWQREIKDLSDQLERIQNFEQTTPTY